MKRKVGFFDVINDFFMILIAIICIYPFWNTFAVSISDGRKAMEGNIYLLPEKVNVYAYAYLLQNVRLGISQSLINSILYTLFGTLVGVAVTFMTAYVLTRPKLQIKGFVMMLFMISWVFSAGIVPEYVINHALGLVNNPLVMIIPSAVNTFLLIVTRSFLFTIPEEMEEAAYIDGANDFQIMMRVFLPLSVPVIATISLFYAVEVWNRFMTPLIYLQSQSLQPLQLVLYNYILNAQNTTNLVTVFMNGYSLQPKNLQASLIILSMLPILLVYPFVQKYLIKGMLIGAVKG